MDRIAEAARGGQDVAVVFGREDWGMSNAMLDSCHAVTTIPTNPAYPSLNLAQAALLVLYQLFQRAGGEAQAFRSPRRSAPPAPSRLLEDLFADLERALDAVEFLKARSRTHTCARCASPCSGLDWTFAKPRCCARQHSKFGIFCGAEACVRSWGQSAPHRHQTLCHLTLRRRARHRRWARR